MAKPSFDDFLRLMPGVGGWLVRLAPLIRPLVQAKWASRVDEFWQFFFQLTDRAIEYGRICVAPPARQLDLPRWRVVQR